MSARTALDPSGFVVLQSSFKVRCAVVGASDAGAALLVAIRQPQCKVCGRTMDVDIFSRKPFRTRVPVVPGRAKEKRELRPGVVCVLYVRV